MDNLVLLGDEAVALGALHAGLSAAYGYPGTPSTEIMEYLIAARESRGRESGRQPIIASWCANEKTAYEAALGMSFAGKRVIVTMKHVGLNVAADPFVNSALLDIKGGLVLAVADDPSMHSSQDEQDSRFYADYAGIPCLEPRSQQEAYDMAGLAFDLSEKLALPVMLRLTTRLAHARAAVSAGRAGSEGAGRPQNKLAKASDRTGWILLPAYARKRYELLCAKQADIAAFVEASGLNQASAGSKSTVVITAGLGGNYYEENLPDFIAANRGGAPARLHIGAYPAPVKAIRELCEGAGRVIVIEEGQPFLEKKLRGILEPKLPVNGKLDGLLPLQGELTPDNVRASLGLPDRPRAAPASIPLPARPPQLCQGCPHGDSYKAIKDALADLDPASVSITADIGCYALGALPPFSVPETLVCMGASISMAGGAADAGIRYPIGVIGDSTFLHSGIGPLIDAVSYRKPITAIILDNSIVAMTGCQDTILPSERLRAIAEGIGVEAEHVVEIEATKMRAAENVAAIRREMEYRGPSVIIAKRECLEAFRLRKKKDKASQGGAAATSEGSGALPKGGRE
jgi:indolepyruvate ferredoxin oxidoreductase, alpha subunit